MRIGEQVRGGDSSLVLTARHKVSGKYTVYNLEVYQAHTFRVMEEGVWVHNGCGEAVKAIRNGLKRVTVKSREEAEAILRELYIGGDKGIRNATGFNSTSAKDFFTKDSYYHWDDEMIYNEKFGGYHLKNHDPFTDLDAFTPHLQIHDKETGSVIKIFFDH